MMVLAMPFFRMQIHFCETLFYSRKPTDPEKWMESYGLVVLMIRVIMYSKGMDMGAIRTHGQGYE